MPIALNGNLMKVLLIIKVHYVCEEEYCRNKDAIETDVSLRNDTTW